MTILLKNAKVVYHGSSWDTRQVDIWIKDGLVESIEEKSSQLTNDQIDEVFEDVYITPSFVDGWCQSGEPGFEYRETFNSLRNIARAGGYGHVFILPNLKPCMDHRASVESVLTRNSNNSVKLRPLGALSLGANSEELSEMIDIHQLGVSSFTDGNFAGHSIDFIIRSMEYLKVFEGKLHYTANDLKELSQLHVNQSHVSSSMGFSGQPKMSEVSRIKQLIDAAIYTSGRLHLVNISSKESVDLIREYKAKLDIDLTCSVAAMNLIFTEHDLSNFDENLKLNPPLRSEKDRQALIEGVKDGTIDCINSNHTPLSKEEKMMEFAYADFGCISMQNLFVELKEHNLFSDQELISALALRPRSIFGIEMKDLVKGISLSDIVIWRNEEWKYDLDTNLSKSVNSPLFGKSYQNKIITL